MEPTKSNQGQLTQRKETANIGKRGYLTRGIPKTGTGPKRNDKCPCNSGLKYKKCCLGLDEGWMHEEENGKRLLTKRMAAPLPIRPQAGFDLGETIRGDGEPKGAKLGPEVIA